MFRCIDTGGAPDTEQAEEPELGLPSSAAPPHAIRQSFGVLVNWLDDIDRIGCEHESFVRDGSIVRLPDVNALRKA